MSSRGELRTESGTRLSPLTFAELAGWASDGHALAFAAFLRSAASMRTQAPDTGSLGIEGHRLAAVGERAKALEASCQTVDAEAARRFFEANFQPMAVQPHDGSGFLTGYYEPEVEGSLSPTERFRYPLLARPGDLLDVDGLDLPPDWPEGNRFARIVDDRPTVYFDRRQIESGALDGRGLELVYLADPVECFLVHVQGSARIRLADGRHLRVAYAAKAGHPYTSIGKRLIERGAFTAGTMTLAALKTWLQTHPEAGRELMWENRSYVFFQIQDEPDLAPDLGAIAAAGVQITPGRSLAVDHRVHAYGCPIWIEADLPADPAGDLQPFARLMIAQDTGSAILGPARGDIFFGLGPDAERQAGRIRHVPRRFVVLVPRDGEALA